MMYAIARLESCLCRCNATVDGLDKRASRGLKVDDLACEAFGLLQRGQDNFLKQPERPRGLSDCASSAWTPSFSDVPMVVVITDDL